MDTIKAIKHNISCFEINIRIKLFVPEYLRIMPMEVVNSKKIIPAILNTLIIPIFKRMENKYFVCILIFSMNFSKYLLILIMNKIKKSMAQDCPIVTNKINLGIVIDFVLTKKPILGKRRDRDATKGPKNPYKRTMEYEKI